MKKQILVLASVLALVAALVAPMAVLAKTSDTTTVSGEISAVIEVLAPSSISLGDLNSGEVKTGHAATDGTVYATGSWTLGVTASYPTFYPKDYPEEVLEIFAWLSLDNAGVVMLAMPLGIGTTADSIADLNESNVVGSIGDYQAQIEGLTGYGTVIESFALPLYVEQKTTTSDITAGTYSVVLTYTGTLT